MSDGLNRVILVGNIGAEPELRQTREGAFVLHFNLATNESYLDRNKEKQERTEWHSVVMFGVRAEALSKILSKGSSVHVEGSLRTSTFEANGTKRTKTEIVARDIGLLGKREPAAASDELVLAPTLTDAPSAGARNGKNGNGKGGGAQTSRDLDEIPF